ncbi:MAG TPA: plastocyanin/azurin family copper-binding protein [Longimicrobium sp.]|nr:plastocyanin/azurin family copper-binding protein [Longimicrobium sp.]
MNTKALFSYACSLFAALVAVAGLGGCFSEHAQVLPPTGQDLCTGTQPANVVRIIDFGFTPSTVTVPRGGTVRWVNCSAGAIQHTSTADGGAWDSKLLPQFTIFEQAMPTAGTFAYHCNPHPFMKGSVVVQ